MDNTLEVIMAYEMNDLEAKAFKIACIYVEKANKMLPEYKNCRLPKGDPRKSELFRYCHKLARETQGKIADEDYTMYIHAQLDILRNIKVGDGHAFVNPSCIAGQKAWRRWLLWKSKYDKMQETKHSKAAASTVNVHSLEKIKKDLWKTKQFFLAWFDKLDKNDIMDSLKDKNMWLWYQTGSVCGYYLVLSSLVQEWLKKGKVDLKKDYNIDLLNYKDAEIAKEHFVKEFSFEQ